MRVRVRVRRLHIQCRDGLGGFFFQIVRDRTRHDMESDVSDDQRMGQSACVPVGLSRNMSVRQRESFESSNGADGLGGTARRRLHE